MAIITAAGLTDLYNQRAFNKNGSTVTLKKISETDWLLFGDLAEGDSEGFGGGGSTSNGRMKLIYNTALSRDMWVGQECEVYYEGEKLPRPMSGSHPVSGRMPFPEEGNILIELDFMERHPGHELPYLSIDGGALLEILDWGEFPSWVNKVGFISFSNYLEKVPDTLPRQITVLDGLFTHAPKFNQDISGWDVSNVTSMRDLFYGAKAFNQDLSGWCVSNIPSQPSNFATNATSWTLPKPIWGTCP